MLEAFGQDSTNGSVKSMPRLDGFAEGEIDDGSKREEKSKREKWGKRIFAELLWAESANGDSDTRKSQVDHL